MFYFHHYKKWKSLALTLILKHLEGLYLRRCVTRWHHLGLGSPAAAQLEAVFLVAFSHVSRASPVVPRMVECWTNLFGLLFLFSHLYCSFWLLRTPKRMHSQSIWFLDWHVFILIVYLSAGYCCRLVHWHVLVWSIYMFTGLCFSFIDWLVLL